MFVQGIQSYSNLSTVTQGSLLACSPIFNLPVVSVFVCMSVLVVPLNCCVACLWYLLQILFLASIAFVICIELLFVYRMLGMNRFEMSCIVLVSSYIVFLTCLLLLKFLVILQLWFKYCWYAGQFALSKSLMMLYCVCSGGFARSVNMTGPWLNSRSGNRSIMLMLTTSIRVKVIVEYLVASAEYLV